MGGLVVVVGGGVILFTSGVPVFHLSFMLVCIVALDHRLEARRSLTSLCFRATYAGYQRRRRRNEISPAYA